MDSVLRVVVISGAGPAFCAGHDLRELRDNDSPAFYTALFAQCGRLMQRIVSLPQPVIASVNGTATAAGCQLVASCDLAVASDSINAVGQPLTSVANVFALIKLLNNTN